WPGSTLSTFRYASIARSISPFSSNAIPSTKRVSASALCAPCERKARSGGGFELTESSCRPVDFVACARGIFAGEALGWPCATVAATKKLTAKMISRREEPQHFFCTLTAKLIFLTRLRQTTRSEGCAAHGTLELVTQPLLMPVRLHALTALVLGNLCFPSFFERAHSEF